MRRWLSAVLFLLSVLAPLPGVARPVGEALLATGQALVEREIGSLIIVGFAGTRPGDAGVEIAAMNLRAGRIGGVIFFDENVVSRSQVKTLVAYFRTAARAGGSLPLIALDEEGGAVQRLTAAKGFASEPSAARMAKTRTPDEAFLIYSAMAQELAALGFNLNLGPVVDLDLNHKNTIISRVRRSYGASPDTVEAYAEAFIAAHRRAGVLTAIKHWPGHGSALGDTHKTVVDITATFDAAEKEPFERLSAGGYADIIMIGHLASATFDGERALPASLSPAANAVLRREARYNGVTMTDDLSMAAVVKVMNPAMAAVAAIRAGNDLVLFGDPTLMRSDPGSEIFHALQRQSTLPLMAQRLREAHDRVTALKLQLK